MQRSTLVLEPSFTIAPINLRISSAPSSSTWADASTPASTSQTIPAPTRRLPFRRLDLVRELGVTVVRYPDPSFPMDQVSGLTGMAQSV